MINFKVREFSIMNLLRFLMECLIMPILIKLESKCFVIYTYLQSVWTRYEGNFRDDNKEG